LQLHPIKINISFVRTTQFENEDLYVSSCCCWS
jgi:hypothetical protein